MHLSSTYYRHVAQHCDMQGYDVVAAAPLNDPARTRHQPLILAVLTANGTSAVMAWFRVALDDTVVEYDRETYADIAPCLHSFADLVANAEVADNGMR